MPRSRVCFNRRMLIKALASALSCFILVASQTAHPRPIVKVSVCDVRERPDEFGGKVIQIAGWVYTDIERFGLQDQNCGVALRWPEKLDEQRRTKDEQVERFSRLLKRSKKNPFETDGQLFTIMQGRFETAMVRKDGQLVMEGSGYGGGAGSAPSVLTIQRVVCSVVAPINKTSIAEASKRCIR